MRLVLGDGVRHVQPGKPGKHLLATAGLPACTKSDQVQRYGEPTLSWMQRRALVEETCGARGKDALWHCSVWPTAVSDGLLPSHEAD